MQNFEKIDPRPLRVQRDRKEHKRDRRNKRRQRIAAKTFTLTMLAAC